MSVFAPSDDGSVRVLTLTRPPGNALGIETLRSLSAGVAAAGADAKVRALVLASGLPRYFSSGLDIAEIMELPPERRPEAFEALLGAYRALLACPKPVVGALSGVAILGGWIVAMGCDWRVLASESGKIALSEVRLGLTPTPLLATRLAALSRDPRAVKEMILRGKILRAAEALEAGLVDETAPEAEVAERARALARKLAKSAPAAYARIKAGLNAPFLDEGLWSLALEEFHEVVGGAEAREGMEAMRAKRRPRWED